MTTNIGIIGNRKFNPDVTLKDAGIGQGAKLILMPDPTGGIV